MRSSKRCRRTFQGDRCRKERDHDSNLRLNPDPWHEGLNVRWNDETHEELHPPSQFNRKNLRALSRTVHRNSDPRGLSKGQRQAARLQLSAVQEFIQGGKREEGARDRVVRPGRIIGNP